MSMIHFFILTNVSSLTESWRSAYGQQCNYQRIYHQLFTKNEIVTDAECLDILHTYFKLPLYTIAAFAPDTKNNNGSYQHDVISFIPGYASGCRDCIVWFYRTENHELLLIFNHNEDFNIKNCITGIHNYFSKRYNCRTLWGISRPCGNFSEFIFAKKRGTYMPF